MKKVYISEENFFFTGKRWNEEDKWEELSILLGKKFFRFQKKNSKLTRLEDAEFLFPYSPAAAPLLIPELPEHSPLNDWDPKEALGPRNAPSGG